MSNRNNRDEDQATSVAPTPRSWRQRYGAVLLFAGFALATVLMVVVQKKGLH